MPEELPNPEGEAPALDDPEALKPEPEPPYAKLLTRNQRRFLEAYKLIGVIGSAAKAAHLERTVHYNWMKECDYYPQAFADAEAEADDNLMTNARRRAMDSSDRLMERFLEARFPEFRRKQDIQVSGAGGGPIGLDVAAMDARCREDPAIAVLVEQLGMRVVMSVPKPVSPHMLPQVAAAPPPTTNGHASSH